MQASKGPVLTPGKPPPLTPRQRARVSPKKPKPRPQPLRMDGGQPVSRKPDQNPRQKTMPSFASDEAAAPGITTAWPFNYIRSQLVESACATAVDLWVEKPLPALPITPSKADSHYHLSSLLHTKVLNLCAVQYEQFTNTVYIRQRCMRATYSAC